MTKKYHRIWLVFAILSILLNVGPLAAYSIIALAGASLVIEKVALSMTVLVVLIMTAVAFLNKTTMKSRVFVIIIGLYLCLDHFITPLLIISACQIVDEWIASPISHHYRDKFRINKEIDKRGV